MQGRIEDLRAAADSKAKLEGLSKGVAPSQVTEVLSWLSCITPISLEPEF